MKKQTSPLLRSNLIKLNRNLTKHVEFAVYTPPDEQKPSLASRLGKAAAVVGAGAAAYGGASYLRGKLGQKPGDWNLAQNRGGMSGVMANIKAGHSANVGDVKTALGAVKSKLDSVSAAAAPVTSAVKTATNAVTDRAGALATAAKNQASSLKNTLAIKSRLFRGTK
jgi:hypothetical protein